MRIDHDLHVHTFLSYCSRDDSANVAQYVENAKKNGIRRIGFADHMWDDALPSPIPEFYVGQNFDHLARTHGEIAAFAGETDVEMLFGCETDYDYARRDIALTEETAQKFDFILVPNSHTHIVMPKEFYEPKEKHARFMFDAFMDVMNSPLAKYVSAMVHPFDAVGCPYDRRLLYPLISDAQYREAFCAAREKGIAIEVNTSCFDKYTICEIMDHPAMEMFEIARDCGCFFTFGSDAHKGAPGEIQDRWDRAYLIARLLDLKDEDIAPIARGAK